jgi:hypothetical protein
VSRRATGVHESQRAIVRGRFAKVSVFRSFKVAIAQQEQLDPKAHACTTTPLVFHIVWARSRGVTTRATSATLLEAGS